MKTKSLSFAAAAAALGGSALFFYSFTKWIPALYSCSVVLFGFAAGLLTVRFAERGKIRKGVIAGAVFTAAFFALTFLVNNVILHAKQAPLAAGIVCGITFVFFVMYYSVLSRGKQRNRILAALAFVLSAVLTLCSAAGPISTFYYKNHVKKAVSPAAGKTIEPARRSPADHADYFVSPDGDDANDGSFAKPFQTIEKARDTVRATDKTGRSGITVALMGGEYRVSALAFTAEDSGTKDCPITYRAYDDEEVILNGGVTLPQDRFTAVTDEQTLSRLSPDARKNVRAVDLFSLGITAEQYGKLYAIGSYSQAGKYDGDWTGDLYCELFIDDCRQTIARYPNGAEYLYSGAVVKEGQGRESSGAAIKEGYDELRNPEPDVYRLDKALSERIRSWKTTDGVWMFGYPRYDWADCSSPIGAVDHDNLTISPMFVSGFGAIEGAPFYFYNVLEELDAPGEWYLDRDNGMLYFYPPEGFSETSTVELSLSTDNIIKSEADYLTFDGITIKGTRGDAVSITGDGNTVKNCLIKNAAGNALIVSGYDNLVRDNEITRTGKGGVILGGGDRESLKAGNNRAENNLVHDWSEIYETYQPAFSLDGVGNVCAHNEMYNSPHEAITYSGNNHIVEYNLIHDVNLKTDDGGAIYSGRRWDWYGNVIRYNLIYDLGADGHRPQGIYMDDGISGQAIYGNVLINVPCNALMLGGGRDLDVHDNIVINAYCPISYDERMHDGLPGHEDSNFYPHYTAGGDCWQNLFASPWQSAVWQTAYPQYAHYSDDFSNPDDPDFVLNPAYSSVTHNLLISARGEIGSIADAAERYSTVADNACFKLSAVKKLFVDPENGDYTLRDNAEQQIGFAIDVPVREAFGRQ